MHKHDFNRVAFYSKEDMAGGFELSKGENILRNETKSVYEDINDILELYNIKKYLDNDFYLKSWSLKDIAEFKKKAIEYGNIVGRFMSQINDSNFKFFYDQLLHGYINSFWEIVNNQKIQRKISSEIFEATLKSNPHEIRIILTHKDIVSSYNNVLRRFLLEYSKSAEILLSIYEAKDDFNNKKEMYLPKSLTIQDKENIVLNYIDSVDSNINYLRLIKNARIKDDFNLSDKTRLRAKRKEKEETDKLFEERNNISLKKYGVSICFPLETDKIKDLVIENSVRKYTYSLSYIKEKNDYYSLFLNFIILFDYLDFENRIDLVSKKSQMDVMELLMGIHSQNEYRYGFVFTMHEMSSQAQIVAYCSIINDLGESLENILQRIFTSIFNVKYGFANNARLSMPSPTASYFEKVRFLAPEFESVLKQYKYFVDDGEIDIELLQMSSTPCSIKDIPSLTPNKYLYLNEDNKELMGYVYLFFSDQTLLAYVKPYEEKYYKNLFALLVNEHVNFDNYEEHQKPQINHLINKGLLLLDKNNFIQITNISRILILKDLYENEFASFYHYPKVLQEETMQMKNQNMVYFESSLLSKSEQSYFNYYLNKSEFSNGFDLRNKYLHGTQANPEEIEKHESAYFIYLKLLVLVLLKIEDDLIIYQTIRK